MKGAAPAPLTVIATPIGNLDDLSPRAAQALRDADVVACEDTRRTATLLRHARSEAPMVPVHRHNEAGRGANLIARLQAGEAVALVSDAGMPTVSDPGARLVGAAHAAGLPVSVIPGPSAVATALAASGLAASAHLFVGFLPRADDARARLWSRADDADAVLVAFESPSRLPASLASLAAHDSERRAVVCRELTKIHEDVVADSAAALAARFATPPKGEVTLVVDAPAGPAGPSQEGLAEGLALMLDGGLSPRAAAAAAAALGAPRNAAYRLATELARAGLG